MDTPQSHMLCRASVLSVSHPESEVLLLRLTFPNTGGSLSAKQGLAVSRSWTIPCNQDCREERNSAVMTLPARAGAEGRGPPHPAAQVEFRSLRKGHGEKLTV